MLILNHKETLHNSLTFLLGILVKVINSYVLDKFLFILLEKIIKVLNPLLTRNIAFEGSFSNKFLRAY